jgi:hypothetical protein
MDQINASHHFEQFAREMASAPDTGRRHADLAWIGLRTLGTTTATIFP